MNGQQKKTGEDRKSKIMKLRKILGVSVIIRLYWKSKNAHISKPVEMEVLKKTIKSIKISGWGAQIPISKLCPQDMEMRFVR